MGRQLPQLSFCPHIGVRLKTCFPRSLMAAIAIAAYAVAIPATAAGDDPIATDRPDFVESSAVVGKGRLQVETSAAVDRTSGNGERETVWSTPTLLRFGVSDTIELRMESDGAIGQRTSAAGSAATERGYGDLSLGVKWHAMDARDQLPSVALLLHADLSTGSAAFRDEGTRPSARVAAEWELDNEMSLGVMPGIGYEKQDGGKMFGILGLVVGKAWNDRLRSFVEVSSPHIARSANGGSEASLTVGSAYLVSNTVQVDTALARGLNRRTADLSLTFGLSFKL